MVQQTSTNNFGPAKWLVNASAPLGTHTTIATALTSASSGDTIFIMPGTYTENLTLKQGVNLAAYECDAYTPNVIILGKATYTSDGPLSISGIQLKTNSDFFLAVTGTLASVVNLNNCNLNCINNTGISFTTSSASAAINITDCTGNVGTTGIGFITHSSAGTCTVSKSKITNTGASTTVSTCSAGSLNILHSEFSSPFTYSTSATSILRYNVIDTSAQNAICITTSGTGNLNIFFTSFSSGSAAALSIGTGTSISGINITVGSTNTNPVTGAGTYGNGGTTFTTTGRGINVTTQQSILTKLGESVIPLQPAFLVYPSASITNVTGDGTVYTVAFDTEAYDQAANFASNTFTAPITGKYLLCATITVTGVAAGNTAGFMNIVTTARSYRYELDPAKTFDANTIVPFTQTVVADMTANDTATITVAVFSGTKIVGLQGGAAPVYTYFSGCLLC